MGQLIAGSYELGAEIGRGPTGTVWRARHRGTRETFALKLLAPEFVTDPAVVDRFLRERSVLMAYLHPSMVPVRDVILEEPELVLVTDLVDGVDLRRYLGRSGPLDLESASQIVAVSAEALGAAHAAGVVHSGVKPANVLVTRSNEVRITDCRVTRLTRRRRNGAATFTDPEYVAPEVILGGPPVPASDVYGLGLVLYEAVMGGPLCRGDSPAEVLNQHLRGRPVVPTSLPHPLRDLLEACLAIS
ncbi:MAG: serine/threonine protein kinase, partial [Micromonosporaceae bacterium]|nr:serine/threonine protein kinase [Micromonosporaceae bacterium]